MSDEDGITKCPCCDGQVQVYWDADANQVRVAHRGEACQGWLLAVLMTDGPRRAAGPPQEEA